MQQKIEENLFVCEIISAEFVSLNCPSKEKDTFHGQPMC